MLTAAFGPAIPLPRCRPTCHEGKLVTRSDEALLDELVAIVDQFVGAEDEDDLLHPKIVRWEPELAVSELLCADAVGIRVLPDEVVNRLWQITHDYDFEEEFVLPPDVLKMARPGRRTRPPAPLRFPLKGGGHGSGRGQGGKTEWPQHWTDDDAMVYVMEVATRPDGAVTQPDGTFRARGKRKGVDLRVVITADGEVVTAYPVSGKGVLRNPIDDVRAPYVERLAALVAATDLDPALQESIDEQMAVGEWDQVLLALTVIGVTPAQAEELSHLRDAAGIRTPG